MPGISIKDLLENSKSYDKKYGLTQSDAIKANDLYRRIITSRNNDKPMPGDIMICQGPEKTYFSGHVAFENLSHHSSVCVQPYVPFVSTFCCKRDEIIFDTSGGYWFSIPKEKVSSVIFIGKQDKLFKSWGHCGHCANGAFTFSCKVNVWCYESDDIY